MTPIFQDMGAVAAGGVQTPNLDTGEPYREFERQYLGIAGIDPNELQRVNQLFVASPGYITFAEDVFGTSNQGKYQKRSNQRILFIVGPKGSGRLFTAKRLAANSWPWMENVPSWHGSISVGANPYRK